MCPTWWFKWRILNAKSDCYSTLHIVTNIGYNFNDFLSNWYVPWGGPCITFYHSKFHYLHTWRIANNLTFPFCLLQHTYTVHWIYIYMFVFYWDFHIFKYIFTILRTGSGCVAWDSNSGFCQSSRHWTWSSVSLPQPGRP